MVLEFLDTWGKLIAALSELLGGALITLFAASSFKWLGSFIFAWHC